MFEKIVFFVMILWAGSLVFFLVMVVRAFLFIILPSISCIGEGKILKKWYQPARKTKELVDTNGFGMFAHFSKTIPESWRVCVQIEGQIKTLHISEELYDALSIGESVSVNYEHLKFSKEIFLKSISTITA